MGESEILMVVVDGGLRTQEMSDLIERIRQLKGVSFVRTMNGVVQDVIEANASRQR
jgi:hypothetical protein